MKKAQQVCQSGGQILSHKSRKRINGKKVQEIANFLIQEPNFIQTQKETWEARSETGPRQDSFYFKKTAHHMNSSSKLLQR